MSGATSPPSAAVLAARADLAAAQQERAALTTQLRSLRYAADLTAGELSRRTAPTSPSPSPSPTPSPTLSTPSASPTPPPSPSQLEADLLAAKAAATAARQRVHALEAEAAALRRRPRARALSPLSPQRRSASRRAIAQFDALVELGADDGGDYELLPCHVSVSAACALAIHAVGAREEGGADEGGWAPRGVAGPGGEPVLVVEPPFVAVGEVAPLGGDRIGALQEWMSSLAVRAWPPAAGAREAAGGPVEMLLCGVSGAVRDAQALVRDHGSSPLAVGGGGGGPDRRVEGVLVAEGGGEGKGKVVVEAGLLAAGRERVAAVAHESAAAARNIAAGLSSRLGALKLRGLGASLTEKAEGGEGTDGESMGQTEVVPVSARGRGGSPSLSRDVPVKVRMLGGTSGVLSPAVAVSLMAAVPSRFTDCSLRLLYSTRVHGISLLRLYGKCAGQSPTILAFRDSGGARFGCFATAPWAKTNKQTYYGTGESFCWKAGTVNRESNGESGAGNSEAAAESNDSVSNDSVSIYKWSRSNNFFQCSSPSYLAFGGGGHFAVRIDDDLQRGSSGDCETFNSPCLASDTEFDCVVLEAWTLETTSRLSTSR